MNNMRNKVQLIGRLGNDPEVKEVGKGKLARFSIATKEVYRNSQGEKVEETQWHYVVMWGKLAEITEKYLEKGKEVAIEGKLNTRKFEDKDGNTRYITEVRGIDLVLLGSKKAG